MLNLLFRQFLRSVDLGASIDAVGGLGASGAQTTQQALKSTSDVVFAYRLLKIMAKGRSGKTVEGSVHQPKNATLI